jgi:hypothetical protein
MQESRVHSASGYPGIQLFGYPVEPQNVRACVHAGNRFLVSRQKGGIRANRREASRTMAGDSREAVRFVRVQCVRFAGYSVFQSFGFSVHRKVAETQRKPINPANLELINRVFLRAH